MKQLALIGKHIKKYKKQYPQAIVEPYEYALPDLSTPDTKHLIITIKISWGFGSFMIIKVDKNGTESILLAYDKGLINSGLENILNHFNAQNEQTNITEQFRKADGTLPTVDEFNKLTIGGDITIN
tara:strand:- start:118 stop:495 length:378 start_codon:yes stop_codon:yes gene_type:complete